MRDFRARGIRLGRRLSLLWRRRRVSILVALVVGLVFFVQFSLFIFASNGPEQSSNNNGNQSAFPPSQTNVKETPNQKPQEVKPPSTIEQPRQSRLTSSRQSTRGHNRQPANPDPPQSQNPTTANPPAPTTRQNIDVVSSKPESTTGDSISEALASSDEYELPKIEFPDANKHAILAILTYLRIPSEIQWFQKLLSQLQSTAQDDKQPDVIVFCSYCSKTLPELSRLESRLSSEFPFVRMLDVCTLEGRDPFMEMDYLPNLISRGLKSFSTAVSKPDSTRSAEFFMLLEPDSYLNLLLPQFLRNNIDILRAAAAGTGESQTSNLFVLSALQTQLGAPLFFNDISAVTGVGTPNGESHSTLGKWIAEGRVWYWLAKSSLSNYHHQMIPTLTKLVLAKEDEVPLPHYFESRGAVPDTLFFVGHSSVHLRLIKNITNSMVSQYKHEIRTTFRMLMQRITAELLEEHIGFRSQGKSVSKLRMDLRMFARQFIVYAPRSLEPGVTLATHLTLDRLSALELSMRRWKGPVSVAFSAQDEEKCNAVLRFIENHRAQGRQGLHATCLVHTPDLTQLSKPIYPVNWLRNLALENVDTQLVLILDVDFVVDRHLYDYIINKQNEPLDIESYNWLPLNTTDRNLPVQYAVGGDGLFSNVNRYAATNYEVTDITTAIGFVHDTTHKPVQRMTMTELMNQTQGRAVFVVPAFEFSKKVIENNPILTQYVERGTRIADIEDEAKTDEMFVQYLDRSVPRDFRGLLQEISSANMEPILISIEPPAHVRYIDYPRWIRMTSERDSNNRTIQVARLPDWPNMHDRKSSKLEELEELVEDVVMYEIAYGFPFEPYVIGSTNHLPFFSSEFEYYGNDKVLYFSRLDAAAFRYYVVPQHFMVHLPHGASKWADPQIRKQLEKQIMSLTKTFYRELKKMYSKRAVIRQRRPRRARRP